MAGRDPLLNRHVGEQGAAALQLISHLIQALKKRAGAHGRSQAAELRAILSAALLSPPRCNLAELL